MSLDLEGNAITSEGADASQYSALLSLSLADNQLTALPHTAEQDSYMYVSCLGLAILTLHLPFSAPLVNVGTGPALSMFDHLTFTTSGERGDDIQLLQY